MCKVHWAEERIERLSRTLLYKIHIRKLQLDKKKTDFKKKGWSQGLTLLENSLCKETVLVTKFIVHKKFISLKTWQAMLLNRRGVHSKEGRVESDRAFAHARRHIFAWHGQYYSI